MINLERGQNKNYYILIDRQGGNFGGERIFEGIKEVAEQFEDWADMDEHNINGMTIADCLDQWEMGLKQYNGTDFIQADNESLNYIIK